MAKLTFRGGVHPYDGKDLSKDKPMKTIVPKGEMVYPLSQHIGAPSVPLVEKGQQVKTGDCIAGPAEGLSVGIHASADGIVREVNDRYITISVK